MPGLETVMTAVVACSTGSSPSELVVDPIPVFVSGEIAGVVIDGVGGANIQPFGECLITLLPCTPATSVWVPGDPGMLIGGIPALTDPSFCPCLIGGAADAATGGGGAGIIAIVSPNNFTVFM